MPNNIINDDYDKQVIELINFASQDIRFAPKMNAPFSPFSLLVNNLPTVDKIISRISQENYHKKSKILCNIGWILFNQDFFYPTCDSEPLKLSLACSSIAHSEYATLQIGTNVLKNIAVAELLVHLIEVMDCIKQGKTDLGLLGQIVKESFSYRGSYGRQRILYDTIQLFRDKFNVINNNEEEYSRLMGNFSEQVGNLLKDTNHALSAEFFSTMKKSYKTHAPYDELKCMNDVIVEKDDGARVINSPAFNEISEFLGAKPINALHWIQECQRVQEYQKRKRKTPCAEEKVDEPSQEGSTKKQRVGLG